MKPLGIFGMHDINRKASSRDVESWTLIEISKTVSNLLNKNRTPAVVHHNSLQRIVVINGHTQHDVTQARGNYQATNHSKGKLTVKIVPPPPTVTNTATQQKRATTKA
jgi:hypothetical protein